jgi:hypothetical protein
MRNERGYVRGVLLTVVLAGLGVLGAAELSRAQPSSAQAAAVKPPPGKGLTTAFLFEARVAVGEPQVVGPSSHGLRRVVPILGGSVQGPRFKGRVSPGGADFQFVRADGVLEIEARYTLEAEDGTLVMITNRGLRRGPKEVIDKLARGERVDPSAYYFRTVAEFEAPAGSKYEWLNASIVVGMAERQAKTVVIRFFEVL